MAPKERIRPRTRRTRIPQAGEIVWDDVHGWGIVVGKDDEARRVAPWTTHDHDSGNVVAWPDTGRSEALSDPIGVVLEPVKLLGAIEQSIDRADDPLATAVEVGYAALLRSDGPRVFRIAWALKVWGCESLVRHELAKLPDWIHRVLTPLAEGWDWGRFARLRRRSEFLIGLLRSSRNVLARVAGAAAALDFEEAVVRRRADDADDLRSALAVGLEQAATPRGVEGAWRRFRSRLLAMQRKYGRQSTGFWEAKRSEGQTLVAERLAASRRLTRS